MAGEVSGASLTSAVYCKLLEVQASLRGAQMAAACPAGHSVWYRAHGDPHLPAGRYRDYAATL